MRIVTSFLRGRFVRGILIILLRGIPFVSYHTCALHLLGILNPIFMVSSSYCLLQENTSGLDITRVSVQRHVTGKICKDEDGR